MLYADVSGLDLSHMRFCAKSIDTYFEIYADGKQIYSYFYEQPYISGVSYGMNMHMVPLPDGTKELKLKVIPIFEGECPLLASAQISDAGMYMGDVFNRGIPSFCLCVMMLLIGFATMVIGMSGSMKGEFVTLGLFASLTALWSINDTMILQLLTQKPEIVRCISYISFILIPYAPFSFISKVTGNKRRLPLTLLSCAVLINLIVGITLNAAHIMDFHSMAGVCG